MLQNKGYHTRKRTLPVLLMTVPVLYVSGLPRRKISAITSSAELNPWKSFLTTFLASGIQYKMHSIEY